MPKRHNRAGRWRADRQGTTEPVPAPAERPTRWTTEYYEDAHGRSPFARWFADQLSSYEQAVLAAAVEQVLEVVGIDICQSEWGKALGQGLFEFRVRQSLHAVRTFGMIDPPAATPGEDQTVLLRVFVTFHGAKVVLLLHGYNKGKDPSPRRQNAEITKARRLLRDWHRQQGTH